MLPAWLKMLRYWQQVEMREGLTLPFLVGVQRYAGESVGETAAAREEFRAILNDASAVVLDHGGYFSLYRCGNVDKWVLREISNSRPPPHATAFSAASGDRSPTLAVPDGSFKEAEQPLESLLDALCDEGKEATDLRRYSCHGKTFGLWTPDDIKLMNRALSLN